MRTSSAAIEPRAVREVRLPGPVPLYAHPEWVETFPWLLQATTARGGAEEAFDLRLFGDLPVGRVLARWRRLREATGFARAVHAYQVHGAELRLHDGGPPGLLVVDDCDAHATRTAGTLLTVSVADCIPIFLVDPERRAVAALHGGWRGVAAGVVEAGVAALRELAGSTPDALHAHLGPAICGACYEVGPEVHEALGLPVPRGNTPVDLRAAAAARLLEVGVPAGRVTTSAWCTRCDDSPFFSHRGGCAERQVGLLGLRGG